MCNVGSDARSEIDFMTLISFVVEKLEQITS